MPQFYLSDYFLKQLKPYAKKFKKLPQDIIFALTNFSPEQTQALGQKVYKLRLKASDLPKGKSKSFRLIVYLWHDPQMAVPITVYFKSDIQNLSREEIKYHAKLVLRELEVKNII